MKISWQKKTQWLMGSILILVFSLSSTAFGAEKIKIGLIGPMKYFPGKNIVFGGTLAVEEINKAGGVVIKGKKYEIELVEADSNEILNISDAVSAMERLITVDKVDFVVGGYITEPNLAMQDVSADHKKIWMSTGSTSLQLCERVNSDYNRYKYTFRISTVNLLNLALVNAYILAVDIEKVKQELGVERPRVALFLEKSIWADLTSEIVLKKNPEESYELVGKWVVSRTASDVTTEMNAIKAAKPHIIYNLASGPNGVALSKAWGELRIPSTLSGSNVSAQSDAHWQATNGMCNYEHACQVIGPVEITEKTIPFFNNIKARYKQTPLYTAGGAYDGVYVLKEAIERAGSLEQEAVIAELERISYRGVQGGIKFTPKGDKLAHDLMFGPGYVTQVHFQWRDGNPVVVWPDGRGRLGDERFRGFKYKGTGDYILPPRMVEYWKAQKK